MEREGGDRVGAKDERLVLVRRFGVVARRGRHEPRAAGLPLRGGLWRRVVPEVGRCRTVPLELPRVGELEALVLARRVR